VPLRIVFCGTPSFAVPSLRHLIAQPEFEIAGVITQPDRPRGRGQLTASSAVKDVALEAGLAVYQPKKIRSESAHDYFRRVAPDCAVIIAYGQIIPASLIEIPRLGWINLHGSLLPKYRGAAPVAWAVLNGESRTGLTTMRIDAGLDTGPLLLRAETEIGADETAAELSARLAEIGAPLIARTLRGLANGEITPAAQDSSQATYARPLKKEDGRIDWRQPAGAIYNRIRGLEPWPGAFTEFRGQKCAIWGRPKELAEPSALPEGPGTLVVRGSDLFAECGGRTTLRIEFAQLEGRKRVTAREFVSGARLASSERFGA
jgi:methionyl-tRNA formyltransferase